MDEIKGKPLIESMIKYLIIFMTLFLSFIVVRSIIIKEFDITGMTVGIIFIFFLIFLKWLIKEIGI